MQKELRDTLAEIVRLQAQQGPLPSPVQNQSVAQSILGGNTRRDLPQAWTGTVSGEDPRGPSPVMRVLDVMSRPLYGVANPTKEVVGQLSGQDTEMSDSWFHSIWRGLSGQDKTTGSDILEAAGLDSANRPFSEKAQIAGASLALDVGLDPLTYAGIGLGSRLGQAARTTSQALGSVEDASGTAARSLTEQISRRAADASSELPPVSQPARTPRPEIPSKLQPQEGQRVFEAGPGPSSVVEQTSQTPRLAITSSADSIAVPQPKPSSSQELLKEIAGQGKQWENLTQRQLSRIPYGANREEVLTALQQQLREVKSPVTRNMINEQIRKVKSGVTPATMMGAARTQAPKAPTINLSSPRRKQAETFARNMAKGKTEVRPESQKRLFERITKWAEQNVNKKDRTRTVFQMLRTAEEDLIARGKKLLDYEGLSARLSDLALVAGGPKSLTRELAKSFVSTRPSQRVEDLRAVTAQTTAREILDPVIQAGARVAGEVSDAPLSTSRTVELNTDLARELSSISARAGASAREASTAKKFLEDLFNPHTEEIYSDLQREARNLVRQSMSGKINEQLIHRINKDVYKQLGENPKALGTKLPQNKVVEAIMTRFATAWNAKDLRPFAKEYIDTARNVAAAFSKSIQPLVRNTTNSQRISAFKVTQGKLPAQTSEEQELAAQFTRLVENLMGAQKIDNGQSVVGRGGVTMRELNDELPPGMKFVEKKGSDDFGREFDYSNGEWMHSWKEWDVSEPAETLYQLTRALQMATRKNSMLEDAAARWGMPVKGGEFTHAVDIPRLDGFWFPEPIAKQLSTSWNRLAQDVFNPGGKAIQLFDKVQRMWKTGVTIYSPSHHIRNLNGDIFLNALDGVVTTGPYRKAYQVLHAHRARYKDMENVAKIGDTDFKELAIRSRPGKTLVKTGAGHKLTTGQILEAAESQGFLLRANILEELVGGPQSGVFGSKVSPFGGRLHNAAATTSEVRDHYARLAHFIDVLEKSKERNLKRAIEIAGRRVKKFHPDGSDLTGFEQNVLRRIIPFYSWLRKSTPLVIEGAVMRPHITMAYPKMMSNMQELTGIETEGPADPFPVDAMFPEWIKEKGIGPVIPPESGAAGIGRQETWKGETPGYVIVNPTNPFTDQVAELGNPKKSALSSITPFISLPVELSQDRSSLGIPISEMEGGTPGYLAQQVPPVGIAARVSGLTRPHEPYHPEQLINWLTSAGVTGTGPYEQQANFEINELLEQMARRERRAAR